MNLRIVLRHGIPAEPLSGRNAVPGLYVKFENGLADVKDEEMATLMLKHSGFDSDFVAIEDFKEDPFKDYRTEKEPEHIVTEMVYGHIGKTTGKKTVLTLEQKKVLKPLMQEMAKEMAVEMAKEMAPEMAKEILKTVLAQKAVETVAVPEPIEENAPAIPVEIINKKKAGRPPKESKTI